MTVDSKQGHDLSTTARRLRSSAGKEDFSATVGQKLWWHPQGSAVSAHNLWPPTPFLVFTTKERDVYYDDGPVWVPRRKQCEDNVLLTGQTEQGAFDTSVLSMKDLAALYNFLFSPSAPGTTVISAFPSYINVFRMVCMSSTDSSTCETHPMTRSVLCVQSTRLIITPTLLIPSFDMKSSTSCDEQKLLAFFAIGDKVDCTSSDSFGNQVPENIECNKIMYWADGLIQGKRQECNDLQFFYFIPKSIVLLQWFSTFFMRRPILQPNLT